MYPQYAGRHVGGDFAWIAEGDHERGCTTKLERLRHGFVLAQTHHEDEFDQQQRNS